LLGKKEKKKKRRSIKKGRKKGVRDRLGEEEWGKHTFMGWKVT